MKQELWLSRDDDGSGWYRIHAKKPILDEFDGTHRSDDDIDIFCPVLFHRIIPKTTRLRRGRKKRIKRILIELED